ncbi:alpha/beta hydrolase [Streptomyces sp. WG-D5]
MGRHTTTLALSFAAVVGLASTTIAAPGTNPIPHIAWTSCGKPELAAFQCATAEVPTDYDDPRGDTTTIALTRLPATDPAHRIGSLFTNPGGPGGSGVQFVQTAGPIAYDPSVRARFDIIGFDPRGVAGSDPVTCFANAEEEGAAMAALPVFPVTPEEERSYLREAPRVAEGCLRRSRERIEHASTANVARDMDLLRQAVGDAKLTYAGYSYGTFLGATYAKLFPRNVRALMLDGTVEPDNYTGRNGDSRPITVRTGQGPAASRALDEFLRLCGAAGPARCALAGLGDPREVVERTLARLKTRPVTIDPGHGSPVEVTYPFAVETLFNGLYTPRNWTTLAQTFAAVAAAGNADLERPSPEVAAYLLTQRTLQGEDYASIGGTLANLCDDTLNTLRPRDFPALAAEEEAKAPHFGRYRTWQGLSCTKIGNEDHDAYFGSWQQKVTVPVMVVGTRYDPATPYRFTRPFADRFPDGRVVTLEGWGHGGTLLQSRCMDRLAARYLIDVEVADGAACRPDTQPFASSPTAATTLTVTVGGHMARS